MMVAREENVIRDKWQTVNDIVQEEQFKAGVSDFNKYDMLARGIIKHQRFGGGFANLHCFRVSGLLVS